MSDNLFNFGSGKFHVGGMPFLRIVAVGGQTVDVPAVRQVVCHAQSALTMVAEKTVPVDLQIDPRLNQPLHLPRTGRQLFAALWVGQENKIPFG